MYKSSLVYAGHSRRNTAVTTRWFLVLNTGISFAIGTYLMQQKVLHSNFAQFSELQRQFLSRVRGGHQAGPTNDIIVTPVSTASTNY